MCVLLWLEPMTHRTVYWKRARARCVGRLASRLLYGWIGRRDEAGPCHNRLVGAPDRRGWGGESCSTIVNCLPRHPAERAQPTRPHEPVQPRHWAALGRVIRARHRPPGQLRTRPAERRYRGQVPVDARRHWQTQNHRSTTGRGRPASPVMGSQRLRPHGLSIHGSHFSEQRVLGGDGPRWQRLSDVRHKGHLAGPG